MSAVQSRLAGMQCYICLCFCLCHAFDSHTGFFALLFLHLNEESMNLVHTLRAIRKVVDVCEKRQEKINNIEHFMCAHSRYLTVISQEGCEDAKFCAPFRFRNVSI